jgi:deoxyribodipyrimidine photo-lyase
MHPVPEVRIRRWSLQAPRGDGEYVLYWMIAYRRTRWNFALQRAVGWAAALRKPLLVLEALRCDYPYASARLHRFVLDGMHDQAQRLAAAGVHYYPYVEPRPAAGRGLLECLAQRACVVVTDDFPCFFLPRMIESAARQIAAPLESVDSNGIVPLRVAPGVFATAHAFRRFVHDRMASDWPVMPVADPLRGVELAQRQVSLHEVQQRWPAFPLGSRRALDAAWWQLPIDHHVGTVGYRGGQTAARRSWRVFLRETLPRYATQRNHPDDDATSGMSPYLHFGHISAHELVHDILHAAGWTPQCICPAARGRRSGWWGLEPAAEAFLDQLVTWRELGFNFCHYRRDYDRFEALPEWAQSTLQRHARDRRPVVYDLAALETAATHDRVWNAAQNQLRIEGRIHNYLRMLWGKKILQWSASPQEALQTMIYLNDKYAVDGRDPNSYSGIGWVLGRYDRPWGPERPIFGTVRYMSSENTLRKVKMQHYLQRFAPAGAE